MNDLKDWPFELLDGEVDPEGIWDGPGPGIPG